MIDVTLIYADMRTCTCRRIDKDKEESCVENNAKRCPCSVFMKKKKKPKDTQKTKQRESKQLNELAKLTTPVAAGGNPLTHLDA